MPRDDNKMAHIIWNNNGFNIIGQGRELFLIIVGQDLGLLLQKDNPELCSCHVEITQLLHFEVSLYGRSYVTNNFEH
jgi:hypothetical protein